MKLLKIDIPWLLKQVGVGKFLRERILHVPQEALPSAAQIAAASAAQIAHMQGRTMPNAEDWFRGVEMTQARIVEVGIQYGGK